MARYSLHQGFHHRHPLPREQAAAELAVEVVDHRVRRAAQVARREDRRNRYPPGRPEGPSAEVMVDQNPHRRHHLHQTQR